MDAPDALRSVAPAEIVSAATNLTPVEECRAGRRPFLTPAGGRGLDPLFEHRRRTPRAARRRLRRGLC